MGASAIPVLLAAASIKQSSDQAKAQNKVAKKAVKASERESQARLDVMDILKGLADNYDPAAQTKTAVDAASGVASATLEKALRNIKVKFGASGPGDSEFHISGQRAANDALDPVRLFAAEQTAQEPMRRADMYARVLGAATGQTADSYFKAAATMPRSDPSGSLALLSQAIQRMTNRTPQPGGAGGSGDSFGSGWTRDNELTGWVS